jgi:hypothetical protein
MLQDPPLKNPKVGHPSRNCGLQWVGFVASNNPIEKLIGPAEEDAASGVACAYGDQEDEVAFF